MAEIGPTGVTVGVLNVKPEFCAPLPVASPAAGSICARDSAVCSPAAGSMLATSSELCSFVRISPCGFAAISSSLVVFVMASITSLRKLSVKSVV